LEKNKSDSVYLEEVVSVLDGSSISRIDFDELKQRLLSVCDGLNAQEEMAGEHALLREEYEQRIAGMIKAIAAVDRKRDRWEEALGLVEELPVMRSAQLLATYRRVAARFRDCFPGSFGVQSFRVKRAGQSSAVDSGR
jgi:hypothetical protein